MSFKSVIDIEPRWNGHFVGITLFRSGRRALSAGTIIVPQNGESYETARDRAIGFVTARIIETSEGGNKNANPAASGGHPVGGDIIPII